MTTILNSVDVIKNLQELDVSGRVLRDFIVGLDGRDALRFTYVPNGNIYFTAYMSEDGEWVQVDCIPSYFDADEFHPSTLVAALVQVDAAYHNEGLVAVNPDDDAVVQLYSEA